MAIQCNPMGNASVSNQNSDSDSKPLPRGIIFYSHFVVAGFTIMID